MKRNRVEANRQRSVDVLVSRPPSATSASAASSSSRLASEWTVASAIRKGLFKGGSNNGHSSTNSPRVSPHSVQLRTVQECKAMANGTVCFVASLTTSTGPRTLQRRNDNGIVELDTLTVCDQSAQDFEVKLWGSHCEVSSKLQPGCIIFFHDFEIGQFRETTSASSRAKSFMRILPSFHSTAVKVEPTSEFQVKQENDAEASPSKKVKLEVSPNKCHSASWREKRAEETVARIANWSDILGAAQSITTWISAANECGAVTTNSTVASARISASTTAAASSFTALHPHSNAASASIPPLTSFASLVAGRIVNICVVIRSCHIAQPSQPSASTPTNSHLFSSTASSLALNTAQAPKPRPLLVLVVSGSEDRDGASNLLELAMYQPQWLEPSWRQTWENSIGQRVQLSSILVQFKKITETMSLSDTRFTTATISTKPHARANILLQPSGNSHSAHHSSLLHRAVIHALEFPLLSNTAFKQFFVQQFNSSVPLPLPHHLFQQLFVASCNGCGEAMSCDTNRVYHCGACFAATPGGEYSQAVRWNYRPALIHLQLLPSPAQIGGEHIVQSFLINPNLVSSGLFSAIDPAVLCDTPSLAPVVVSTHPPSQLSQSLQQQQQVGPAPSVASPYPSQKSEHSESKESMVDSMVPASASSATAINPARARLRVLWMRLMLACLQMNQTRLQYCMIEMPAIGTNSTLQCPQELAMSDSSKLPELQFFSLWQFDDY